MNESKQENQQRGPNPLVRLVAQIRLSIRSKLLIVILGMTLLMAGLAVLGLAELRKSHERTETLIRDTQRIEYFNNLYGYSAELNSIMLALSLDRTFVEQHHPASWFGSLGITASDRAGELLKFAAVGSRRFGKPDMPDAVVIASIIEKLQGLQPLAREATAARRAGDWERAAELGRTEIFEVLRRIQRDSYTRVQQIESEMSRTARATSDALRTSRQQTIGAAASAIGLALIMGYAMSAALLWPLRRISETLRSVAGGGFEARVTVPNRDELGVLAENVNSMSEELGTLYQKVEMQSAELLDLNNSLEAKVTEQVGELDRTNRLRRFLPAQVADMIVGSEDPAQLLGTRRGEITVLFADLRGFTAFSNIMPPAK